MKRMMLLALMVMGLLGSQANAATITSTLTADNHYGLYYGQADGSGLTFVGRNEFGTPGTLPSGGNYNWSRPETFTSVNVPYNSYLYVLAWDAGGPQSWIGQFSGPEGTLLSNTADWQFTVASGANPGDTTELPLGDTGELPSLSIVQGDIAAATWATPLASAPNGSLPWGTIPGISSQADFIWHDTLADNSSSDAHYAIFRTLQTVTPTPEPATMVLMGIGLAGMGMLRRKKA